MRQQLYPTTKIPSNNQMKKVTRNRRFILPQNIFAKEAKVGSPNKFACKQCFAHRDTAPYKGIQHQPTTTRHRMGESVKNPLNVVPSEYKSHKIEDIYIYMIVTEY